MLLTKKIFSEKILEWYSDHRRDLPWRKTKDPYKVWVSEIILQQTRVDQGLPYYQKFIKAFPNVKALAAANQEVVLRLWQGLGYYSRARNMHRCAMQVTSEYKGSFPQQASGLKKLTGIGDYTAAAISSICFNEPAAVVDGNVYRVLSRVFGITTPINSTEGKKEFSSFANQLIPEKNPGDYNQALMEFGALHCTPRIPDCTNCPLAKGCVARKQNLQAMLPVKIAAAPKKERYFNYLLLEKDGKIWMKKRDAGDIWHGLYDFLLIESDKRLNDKMLKLQMIRQFNLTGAPRLIQTLTHILTRQKLHTSFFYINHPFEFSENKKLSGKFFSRNEIKKLPKPVFIDKILNLLN